MQRIPGLVLCGLVALTARYLSSLMGIEATLTAIVMGTVMAPFASRLSLLRPGIWSGTTLLLPLALALLGFKVDIEALSQLSLSAALITLLAMAAVIAAGSKLGARMKASRSLSVLIAVGSSVCGGSAIVAVAPVMRAKESEIAISIATVSLFGTALMIAMPAVGATFSLSEVHFGTWAGGTLQLVPQAVAAGFAYGELAGQVATVVKMGRVLMLAPLVLVLAAVERRRAEREKTGPTRGFFAYVPPFILGYLLTLVLSSLAIVPASVIEAGGRVSSELLLAGMAGVGLGTDFSALRRAKEAALVLGAFCSLMLAALILSMLLLAA